MLTKSKRPPLEDKAKKERQEMNNELVLEGIHPNKKPMQEWRYGEQTCGLGFYV